MNKQFKNLALLCLMILSGIYISCGSIEPIDTPVITDEQFPVDIQIIEDYLATEGYPDYDTLDNGVRVVILDQGDGEEIMYNDNVRYHYIGRLIDGLIFDTSIGSYALDQDIENTVDTTYLKSIANPEIDSLDSDGERIIDEINYVEGYIPIYSGNTNPFLTTHTQGGWWINQSSLILGFRTGTHHVLDNVNLNGKGLILLPSRTAYGSRGATNIPSNAVITFEIQPISSE